MTIVSTASSLRVLPDSQQNYTTRHEVCVDGRFKGCKEESGWTVLFSISPEAVTCLTSLLVANARKHRRLQLCSSATRPPYRKDDPLAAFLPLPFKHSLIHRAQDCRMCRLQDGSVGKQLRHSTPPQPRRVIQALLSYPELQAHGHSGRLRRPV